MANTEMESGGPNWVALQLEQCRTTKLSGIMQAIAAVPLFDGTSGDLEFFIKRMDQIAQQLTAQPLDEATTGYILGFFYSRITVEVVLEIGVSCDTPWEDVKRLLRDKYGGAAKTIPRLIMREVLIAREHSETATKYVKGVLAGFRKIRNRLTDSIADKAEVRIRTDMLEELAQEVVTSNLPRRMKQWIRMVKPASLEALVKVVEEEENEEKEERWEEVKRRPSQPMGQQTKKEQAWQPSRQSREYVSRPLRGANEGRRDGRTPSWKTSEARKGTTRNQRSTGCFECGEEGHFARECPYIYRRGTPRPRSYADVIRRPRPEPMEVNAGRLGARKWDRYSSTSDVSEEESSAPGTKSWQERRKIETGRGVKGRDAGGDRETSGKE